MEGKITKCVWFFIHLIIRLTALQQLHKVSYRFKKKPIVQTSNTNDVGPYLLYEVKFYNDLYRLIIIYKEPNRL